MHLHYNPYFAFLSLTAIISATVALIAQRRSTSSPASKPFVLMMVAITGYATAAALEAAAIALPEKIFWSKLEYVGSGSVITLFLIFALYFNHQQQWLTPRNTALLWLVPSFNVVLVATNDWHRLVWTHFLTTSDSSHTIVYQHGVAFFWVMAWVYVYFVAGAALLVKAALRPSVLHRRQSRMALAGAVIPLLGCSAYMLNLTPPGLNISPMSFMLTGLIYCVSLFRLRLFDLVPVARDMLIESLSDGVLVLDKRNRIIDINPTAHHLLGITASCIGCSAADVLSKWQEIIRLCHDAHRSRTELLTDADTQRYIELRMIPLHDRHKQIAGCLLVLRNVTQQHQAEVKLRQVNNCLQQQLVEIELLQSQLREQAIRDSLTGLFNRRYLEETLSTELRRAAQEGYSVAVMLMDIDFFKQINDTFGHHAGDKVLQSVGKILCRCSRATDIVCRYGGEEFVLVLPRMSLETAYRRAEQIRLSLQTAQVNLGEQKIRVTLSAGLGVFPEHGATSDTLLQRIDQALYAAKSEGRNCIKLV
jgi:diguanylate cyclase (GGDEF)-like protein